MHLRNVGQSQILLISVLGMLMVSLGIFSFDYASQSSISIIQSTKKSEMRRALDEAILFVSKVYRDEAGCDPIKLHHRLNYTAPDGERLTAPTGRLLEIISASGTYEVSLGPVTFLEWDSSSVNPSLSRNLSTSVPQDALIEVWTHFATERVTQKVSLVNSCTQPCSTGLSNASQEGLLSNLCKNSLNPYLNYKVIEFKESSINNSHRCVYKDQDGNNVNLTIYRGDLDLNVNLTIYRGDLDLDEKLSPADIHLMKNALRTGQIFSINFSSGQIQSENVQQDCADLNYDGIMDEKDVLLMEKVLRGYIQKLPVIGVLP